MPFECFNHIINRSKVGHVSVAVQGSVSLFKVLVYALTVCSCSVRLRCAWWRMFVTICACWQERVGNSIICEKAAKKRKGKGEEM